LALAYRYAKDHGYDVPDAHFWALSGDSEFREGSMFEAVPDFAEREIGNLTWMVDYNRQSLDGHRITNKKIMHGTDADRIEATMAANGWEVIQLRHGHKREALFKKPSGELFKKFLEEDLEDYELQSILLVQDIKTLKKGIVKEHPHMKKFFDGVTDQELYDAFRDFGGHDMIAIAEAMLKSKESKRQPTIIIVHTLKGWGLRMAAQPGNHSALPNEEELNELKAKQGIKGDRLFERFTSSTPEAKYLKERGEKLYGDIKAQHALKDKNQKSFLEQIEKNGGVPESLDINLKMASYPHTQWMLGQLTAKLVRVANTNWDDKKIDQGQKALSAFEKSWKTPGELFITMAPDVGTSTNLNPAMDGKIFGAPVVTDIEEEYGVKDTKLPDLVPGEEVSDRFLRFEIAEGNVMSCVGSFGRLRDTLGIPVIPLMTVYDFFVKRALDQYFYNLYWKSSFICVGTPSGVTLSPEGAQHGWKSDIQIPNQIAWEPMFCLELDWILCDAIKRHLTYDNAGRTGVLVRGVTRGIEQKDLMLNLKRQARFKSAAGEGQKLSRAEFPLDGATIETEIEAADEASILKTLREEVLQGAYRLVDYRGYSGYEPGDNVVNIFALGGMGTEALKASEALLERGIYANVIVVTSSDLLCGLQAHENDYHWLRQGLELNSHLYLRRTEEVASGDLVTVAGKRIPIVSVHDGEAGILDNLGSIVGVRHESCAVRKHSKCGRPNEIYGYHGIDAEAVVEACGRVLAETALEQTIVTEQALGETQSAAGKSATHWSELWPSRGSSSKH
jgi:pyruvate dehydrogenase E1 component